jgi:hypothetical protein
MDLNNETRNNKFETADHHFITLTNLQFSFIGGPGILKIEECFYFKIFLIFYIITWNISF